MHFARLRLYQPAKRNPPWRNSLRLGALMNTRGLMELVILNIGLDIGVISPALFSMMVIMALVTTFMTSPVLQLICARELEESGFYKARASRRVGTKAAGLKGSAA